MNLKNTRILVTGAAGGIGSRLCAELSTAGANLALHGLTEAPLQALQHSLESSRSRAEMIVLDLMENGAGNTLVAMAAQKLGGLDMVINLAGVQTFKALDNLSTEQIDRQIALNLTVPVHINQVAARLFSRQNSGTIVNIGSTFGSIGFAQFSVYSAAKFGLRGFSEALRRELRDTAVEVLYIAPRATQTAMNSAAMYEMAEKTNMNIDTPEAVAKHILRAIQNQKANTYIGLPEKFFCKLNALFPGLVDRALAGQNRVASTYARSTDNTS